ncbi:MAG TPA: hypothetical protein VFZ77_04865 [Acidimicrobiales bacterium]
MSEATSTDRPAAPEPATGGTTLADAVRIVAALATAGAAVIHFAMVPEHIEETASHGAFFLATAWVQIAAAAALAFPWPPRRGWLAGTAAFNTGVAALWLLTRTAGLPGDEPEGAGFPDALASALEVVAAASAVAVLLGWLGERRIARPPALVAGVPTVAMVALVTASVVPALGGGHDASTHAHDGGAGNVGESAAAAGGDHDHGAAADGGEDDWSERRIAALTGYLPDAEVQRLRQINMDYLTEQILERSRTLADLPEPEREARVRAFVEWSVDNALLAESVEATGDEPTMHSHGVTPWVDITDPDGQRELQTQLQAAGELIPRFATAADAMEAGYFQVTPYVPGIGAHYLNIELLQRDAFDPAAPEMLLYNGNEPSSELVGLSYAVLAEEPPEGFVGPNDEWHVHPSLCIIGSLVVGPDSTSEEMCESVGGGKGMGFDHPMWMGHLWQVPGWESPWGLFSGENPVVNLATTDVGR